MPRSDIDERAEAVVEPETTLRRVPDDEVGRHLVSHPDVDAVILTGAGKGFCAGLDLKESSTSEGTEAIGTGPAAGLRGQRHISELAIMMHRAPQPIIACVHGAASGGGFALALASDVRVVELDEAAGRVRATGPSTRAGQPDETALTLAVLADSDVYCDAGMY